MRTINAYLTFNGNCRSAMKFYQKCLGGEIYFQTIGDSPLSQKLPAKMRNSILHCELKRENFILMATDMVNEKGLLKGNAISLVLHCKSEQELKKCYRALSAGGKQTQPLETTFWGALFGTLTDKYGNPWLLNYNKIAGDKKSKK